MERLFFAIGAIFAFIAVAAGAFGAHGLRDRLSTEMLLVFETGARYQMYHAFALFAVAWAAVRFSNSPQIIAASGWLFIIGTVLFSGSLYALSLTEIRWLGAITPLGGLAFLAGWLCLAYAAFKAN